MNAKQQGKFVVSGLLSFVTSLIDLLALAFLFMALSTVVNPNLEFLPTKTIQSWLGITEPSLVLIYLFAAIFLLFVLKNIGSYLAKRYQVRFAFEVSKSLSDTLYSQKLHSSLLESKEETTADLNHRINSIAIYFSDYVMLPTLSILSELLLTALILIGVLLYSWPVFVFLMLFIAPAAYLISRFSRKKLKRSGELINAYTPRLLNNTQKLIHGFVELKLAGKEEGLREEFEEIRSVLYEERERMYLHNNVLHTHLMESMVVLGVLVLAIITHQFGTSASLAGVLVLFGTMAFRLVPSLNRIISNSNTLRTFSYVLDMIQVGEGKSASTKSEGSIDFKDAIELKNVSFAFDNGRKVLEGLDLKIKKNQKIGIYGDSGVGKTSLLNLLMGFYTPQKGSMEVDGLPLTEQNYMSWRKHIGYVRQDSFVSNGTVLENIAFGYPLDEIDMLKVEKCMADAKLSSWVHSLDKGLDTEIGELGSKISGGQKQRIAIARMLYKDADFFVLDEITNSLDKTSSAEILNTIYHLNKSNATIVMISHKPEEFHGCDVTYRLQGGHLVRVDNE